MSPVLKAALGVALGGALGLGWQRVVGCRTGACPLMATPLRGITYGAVLGLLFALSGCRRQTQSPSPEPSAASAASHSSKESSMPAASGQVLHVTTGAFPALKTASKPVLLDFWAPWCGPCRLQGPILDEVAARMGERAVIGKVNVDEEPSLAGPYGVQAIPTLVILKGGQVVQRFVGVQQAETLVQALQAAGA